jgi:hypothetical protein
MTRSISIGSTVCLGAPHTRVRLAAVRAPQPVGRFCTMSAFAGWPGSALNARRGVTAGTGNNRHGQPERHRATSAHTLSAHTNDGAMAADRRLDGPPATRSLIAVMSVPGVIP